MIDITFCIPNIHFDFVSVLYDVLIACVTGYIVWYKTYEYALRREERGRFLTEQKEYLRYLSAITLKLRNCKPNDEASRASMEELLEDEPIRSVFVAFSDEDKAVFEGICSLLHEVQGSLTSSKATKESFQRLGGDLSRLRKKIAGIKLRQPPVKFWKFWGRPAIAAPLPETLRGIDDQE